MNRVSGFSIFTYLCQFFFGGWFLFHGLNYWTQFYHDPTILPGPGLLPALQSSGLLAIVKVIEVVVGILMLSNRYVPLAAVMALPITLVIAFVNSSHHTAFGVCVGIIIIMLNATVALGHLDRYLPMLGASAGIPRAPWAPPKPPTGNASADLGQLSLVWHLVAILFGIAAATAITFATVHPR